MSKLKIGVIVHLLEDSEPELRKVADFGLTTCQINSWQPESWTDATFERAIAAAEDCGVEITSFWAGSASGPSGKPIWNFQDGPRTIGLVPGESREQRTQDLILAGKMAGKFGLPSITTHLGFIPEDPNDPNFAGVVDSVRRIAEACGENGVEFWFETGQETPVALLRLIERVGLKNLGVNLDPANLILYGKANPVDSLDVFGRWVRGVHAKDGLYPTDGENLGMETPLGEGKVNFPCLIAGLKDLGYRGALTIEREISGPRQAEDIRKAIELLEPLC
jgi:sugar phosphate isomerase/epimerase